MIKTIILGPPGTGKTTKQLLLLEQELNNYSANEIAFVSFTKKGVSEGVDRAKDKFSLSNKDLQYFRTIHSIAFNVGAYTKSDVLSREHYKEFSTAMGMNFTGYYTEEFYHNDDRYLFYHGLTQNNPRLAEEYIATLDQNIVKHVSHNYELFKKVKSKIDFNDMILNYLKHGASLNVRCVFIDEAQDLTTLQWNFIAKAFKYAEKMYISGDDDQAIYEWLGADVPIFLNLQGDKIILNQSYRLSKDIWQMSKQVSSCIVNRNEKEYLPKEVEGKVHRIVDLSEISISQNESWLLLARNNSFLKKYVEWLSQKGIVFSYKGTFAVKKNEIDAIKIYETMRKLKEKPPYDKEIILMKHLKPRYNLAHPWYFNFSWSDEKVDFYRNIFKNKIDYNSEPTIQVNTIHGAKGGEADNVVLLADISDSVQKSIDRNPDSELRCLYVGMTRARYNLYIVASQSKFSYEDLIVRSST